MGNTVSVVASRCMGTQFQSSTVDTNEIGNGANARLVREYDTHDLDYRGISELNRNPLPRPEYPEPL
jgi:hypothetical protein